MSPRADSIFRSRQLDGRNVSTSFGLYVLSGNQSTNMTVPNHVQLDQELQVSDDMVGSLSTGTAQQLGIVTLPGGKLWECEAGFSQQGNDASAQLCCGLYDLLADATFGIGGMQKEMTLAGNENHSMMAKGFIDTRERNGIVTIEWRILSGSFLEFIFAGSLSRGPTWLKVRSI